MNTNITFKYFTPENRIDDETSNNIFEILIKNESKITGINFIKEECFDTWKDMILSTKDYYIIVSILNNEIVGFLAYSYTGIGLMLSEIQIKENYQGKCNVLLSLLKEFISKIDSTNYSEVLACIDSKHTKSKQVFTHIGFENIEVRLHKISISNFKKWIKNHY